jgi:hypothetical protein
MAASASVSRWEAVPAHGDEASHDGSHRTPDSERVSKVSVDSQLDLFDSSERPHVKASKPARPFVRPQSGESVRSTDSQGEPSRAASVEGMGELQAARVSQWLAESAAVPMGSQTPTPRSPASTASSDPRDDSRTRTPRSPPEVYNPLDEMHDARSLEPTPEHMTSLARRLAEPERPRLSKARPSHRARLIDEASTEQARRLEVYDAEREARAEEFNEKRARLAQAEKRLEQADAVLAAKIAKRTGGRLFMLEGLETQPTTAKGSSAGSVAEEGTGSRGAPSKPPTPPTDRSSRSDGSRGQPGAPRGR